MTQYSQPLLSTDADDHANVNILFDNLHYTVHKGEAKRELHVLKGVSGQVPAQAVTAIFGPTGSGKTSLLDTLARRKRLDWVDGSIFVNGQHQLSAFKRMSGYVVQDDILIGSCTVRENISFSARLRLPADRFTREDKEKLVDEVIADLGLTHCRDTLIGNDLLRGVSGGERKRANIACEVVMRPKVLYLDEPTSGLDAGVAVRVVQCVKDLAKLRNTTVCLSIHQPRYSIFKLFDYIILLNMGEIVYQGAPMGVIDHFAKVGFHCEANDNPADFMFDALSGVVALSTGDVEEQVSSAHDLLVQAHRKSDTHQKLEQLLEQTRARAAMLTPSTLENNVQAHAAYGVGCLSQFIILCERQLLSLSRLKVVVLGQIVVMAMFSGMIGAVYWQLDLSMSGLQDRIGVCFFMIMAMIFSNLSALELLIKERSLFLHQRNAGYFSTGPYFLASICCDMVILRIIPLLVFCACSYPAIGFQRTWEHFFWFLATMLATTIASGALCYLISAMVGVFAVANLIISVCYVVQMLFGGLLVNVSSLPTILHGLRYLSLFQQGYSALAINELHGLTFKQGPLLRIKGDKFLAQQGFGLDDKPMNLALLLGSAVVYLFLGYVALGRIRKE